MAVSNNQELFPIVDLQGNCIGKATRQECHSSSFLLHPVVHLHVLNSRGELFLQKRASTKDIQPDKWDASVGGHVDFGETALDAVAREAFEELGIRVEQPIFLYRYAYRSDAEYELVNAYATVYNGRIFCDPIEIAEGRFFSLEQIRQTLESDIYTPNFVYEFPQLNAALLAHPTLRDSIE